MEDRSYLPEFCTAETLILCCGNRLFGDDGFGPAVAEHLLEHYSIPANTYVVDAGTGSRKLLFTLCLSSDRPRRVVVVDAVDKERSPGELFEISLEEIPPQKIDDFSLHQVPSSNLLHDLKESGMEVRVLVCQTAYIPDHIETGLSESVAAAVPRLCETIFKEIVAPEAEAVKKSDLHQRGNAGGSPASSSLRHRHAGGPPALR